MHILYPRDQCGRCLFFCVEPKWRLAAITKNINSYVQKTYSTHDRAAPPKRPNFAHLYRTQIRRSTRDSDQVANLHNARICDLVLLLRCDTFLDARPVCKATRFFVRFYLVGINDKNRKKIAQFCGCFTSFRVPHRKKGIRSPVALG